jgi:hypothetical protein
MEQASRKWLKWGAFFKVVLKGVLFLNLGQKSRKKGYILRSQNLKRVPFSPPVTTQKGSYFENHFLTWVPSLKPSDPGIHALHQSSNTYTKSPCVQGTSDWAFVSILIKERVWWTGSILLSWRALLRTNWPILHIHIIRLHRTLRVYDICSADGPDGAYIIYIDNQFEIVC